MALDFVNVIDIETFVDSFAGSDVVKVARGQRLSDRSVAIHRTDWDHILIEILLADCD